MRVRCAALDARGEPRCPASADRYWEGRGPPVPPGGPGRSAYLAPYCHGHSWEEPTASGRGRWLGRSPDLDARFAAQEALSE